MNEDLAGVSQRGEVDGCTGSYFFTGKEKPVDYPPEDVCVMPDDVEEKADGKYFSSDGSKVCRRTQSQIDPGERNFKSDENTGNGGNIAK
jgi:hypothetical protein